MPIRHRIICPSKPSGRPRAFTSRPVPRPDRLYFCVSRFLRRPRRDRLKHSGRYPVEFAANIGRKCVFEWTDIGADLLLIFDGIPSVYDRRRRRRRNDNNNDDNNNTERGENGGPEPITRCTRERRGHAGLIRAGVKLSDKPTAGIVYKHSGADVILSPTQTTSVTPHYVPKFLSARVTRPRVFKISLFVGRKSHA